ncbi:hypothetical protein L1987_06575 [Smallanthus sonchifolius]|uniref:Uncharacterized protein n=1 Tax=Smallanthus sonchifolius TaxID=185202 RepID=A0ACB9JYK3_9ASTR|nr:hypothetical protein L1987_06575 [Smallanthus sonchifolius]
MVKTTTDGGDIQTQSRSPVKAPRVLATQTLLFRVRRDIPVRIQAFKVSWASTSYSCYQFKVIFVIYISHKGGKMSGIVTMDIATRTTYPEAANRVGRFCCLVLLFHMALTETVIILVRL